MHCYSLNLSSINLKRFIFVYRTNFEIKSLIFISLTIVLQITVLTSLWSAIMIYLFACFVCFSLLTKNSNMSIKLYKVLFSKSLQKSLLFSNLIFTYIEIPFNKKLQIGVIRDRCSSSHSFSKLNIFYDILNIKEALTIISLFDW